MTQAVTFDFELIPHSLGVDGQLRGQALPRSSGVFRIFDRHDSLILLDKTFDIARGISRFYSYTGDKQALDLRNITGRIEYCRTHSPLETLYLLYSERRRWFPATYKRMRTFPRFHLLKINKHQRFPRIYATRDVKRGVEYFGPFRTRSELDRLRSTLERTFRIRSCHYNIRGNDPYPDCLYFQMHSCSRPCNNDIDRESYLSDIESVIAFIEGREEAVIEPLMERIRVLAEATRFEEAELLRRQVERIRRSRRDHRDTYFDLRRFDLVAVMPSDSVKKRKIAIVKSGCILGFEDHFVDDIERTLATSIQRHRGDSEPTDHEARWYDEFCLVSTFLNRPLKSVRFFALGEPDVTAAKIAAELQVGKKLERGGIRGAAGKIDTAEPNTENASKE